MLMLFRTIACFVSNPPPRARDSRIFLLYRVNVLSSAVLLQVQADTIVAVAVILALLIGQRLFALVRLRLIPLIFSRSHRRAPWKVNEP